MLGLVLSQGAPAEGTADAGLALLFQVAGGLILVLAVGWWLWRQRRRSAGLHVTTPTQGGPPKPPRKPNGEDDRPL